MRHSILAMLVAFGTTITMSATAQQPSTAQKQMAPSEQPSTAQKQMAPSEQPSTAQQQMQNEADKGVKTRNSGESGYVADQEKPGASAQPPGRPGSNQTTTGSSSEPTGIVPKEPR